MAGLYEANAGVSIRRAAPGAWGTPTKYRPSDHGVASFVSAAFMAYFGLSRARLRWWQESSPRLDRYPIISGNIGFSPFELLLDSRLTFSQMSADSQNRIRILIADDHELVRHGLRCVLAMRPGWEVCGEAVDGREAIEKTKLLRPDILLLDITMPYISGLDVARTVSRDIPTTKVLILSQYEESEMRSHALEAGARGYISKNEAGRQLLTAIESLVNRTSHASQSL